MRKSLLLTLALLATSFMSQTTVFAIELARNQTTAYKIVVAKDAVPAEKTAALELQKYLNDITGAAFPIEDESATNATVRQILIGAGPRTRELLPHQNWEALGHDGIVLKTINDSVVLAGGRPRGALYAVYEFLETVAGCRWWTPTESFIPRKSTLNIPTLDTTYIPAFNYREHFSRDVRDNPAFATIMRENGHNQTQDEAWGGHYSILGWVHTYSQLLPPEKYFKDHPEWYSDPENGNRPATKKSRIPVANHTQPCLSNPEVVDELSKNALEWIKQNPQAGYISISQNDNKNFCRDAESVQLAEREESQQAPILKFTNAVAEKIAAQYPDFWVETLAYHGTEKPPKTIRPAKNVVIRLAPSSADFGHPFDSDWNKETRQNLQEWASISPQLFVWNYITNFSASMLPHPNWDVLGKDLKFLAENNVKGIFQQGDSYTNGVGDFVQLRTWLVAKLMWNPNLDQEALTDQFLQGYYGAAAPYLREYLNVMQKGFRDQNRPLSTVNRDYSFITLEVANKCIRLFDQAANADKGDAVLAQRVRRERLALDIVVLYRHHILKRFAAENNLEYQGPSDPALAMDEFIATAQKFGVRNWEQRQSFADRIPQLKSMFTPAIPLPEFARQYAALDVIDVQQGDFWLNRPGSLTANVDDSAASDDKAVSIIGDTTAWAIQVQLNRFLNIAATPWHVYALVRIDAAPNAETTDIGLRSGIYDSTARKAITETGFPVSQVRAQKYQVVDLGTHAINSSMFIWFAPTRNANITKVYVDRVILVRNEK